MNSIISFASYNAVIDVHYHHCFQLVISIQNKINSTLNDIEYKQISGFLINQGVNHSCNALDSSVIVLFIDAYSVYGLHLKKILGTVPIITADKLFTETQLNSFQVSIKEVYDQTILKQKKDFIIDALFADILVTKDTQKDPRVTLILNYINENLKEKIKLEDLAALISLSPERTRHLFVEYTGMPFSQYILWRRIKNIMLDVVLENKSLIDASTYHGFIDQSHFSKIFKRMFGAPAKPLLKNSRFIQFIDL